MESLIAAGGQALANQRILGSISENGGAVKDTAQFLGPPEKIDSAQTSAPVEAALDVVDVDPFAQKAADLRAIMERLSSASPGENLREIFFDLRNFVNKNTDSQFAGGVLSEIGDIVDVALDALDDGNGEIGNFVAFNFDFQFSHKSLQSGASSLEATSLSFSFSFVSENTSFNADVDFNEKILQSPGSIQYTSRESANISLVVNNSGLDKNPVLDSFFDISAKLLGPASPLIDIFPDLAGQGGLTVEPEVDSVVTGEDLAAPQQRGLPDILRGQLASLQQNFDAGKSASELLEVLFARINDAHKEPAVA